MKRAILTFLICACCGALGFATSTVRAAGKIPALLDIPKSLPDDEQLQLNQKRQELENEFAAFRTATDLFNQKDAKDQTDGEFNSLQTDRKRQVEIRMDFNQSIYARVRTLLAETGPVPELEDVSDALPDPPLVSLQQKRADLVVLRDSVRSRRKEYEEHCHICDSATEVKACGDKAIQLLADTESCLAAIKAFNWEVKQSFGEERNRLEKTIQGLDQKLEECANAMKRLGFDRRAQDFERWARISEETKHKVIHKMIDQMLDLDTDVMREGIWEQLTKANGQTIDQMLLKLQILGLGEGAAADALRQYKSTGDKETLRVVAKHLSQDLRSVLNFDEKYQKGDNFEAGLEALKSLLPPGPSQVVSVAEEGAWALYGVGMQSVAVMEVNRLNTLTDKELLAIKKIHSIVERNVLKKYEAKIKLAKLMNENVSDLVKPIISN